MARPFHTNEHSFDDGCFLNFHFYCAQQEEVKLGGSFLEEKKEIFFIAYVDEKAIKDQKDGKCWEVRRRNVFVYSSFFPFIQSIYTYIFISSLSWRLHKSSFPQSAISLLPLFVCLNRACFVVNEIKSVRQWNVCTA